MYDAHAESLFSLQLLVENVQLDRRRKASRELALRVTLLDFPTLLIRQPRSSAHAQKGEYVEYGFNRGKSCFFRMSLRPLLLHLSSCPLHALVLDVAQDTPTLLGSCLLSLAEAASRIWREVTDRGPSRPSSHGERRLIGMCDLSGEKVGTVSLSYNLVYLGGGLLPHLTEAGVQEGRGHDHAREGQIPAGPPACEEEHPNQSEGDPNTFTEDRNAEKGDSSEEDFPLVCPPPLYYCSAAHENLGKEDHNLDFQALTLDDSASEDGGSESLAPRGVHKEVTVALQAAGVGPRSGGPQCAGPRRWGPQSSKPKSGRPQIGGPRRWGPQSGGPQIGGLQSGGPQIGAPQRVLREALHQLPLLNALVAELSQLYGESPHQVSSVPPMQASSQEDASQELPQCTRSRLIHLQPPPSCPKPPPVVERKDGQEQTSQQSRSCNKSHRRSLVYGTTKTLNLRLKLISPRKGNRRECMEAKRQTASRANGTTPRSRKRISSSSRSVSGNPEIQRLPVNSALQETSAARQRAQRWGGRTEQGHTHGISGKAPKSPTDGNGILSTDTDSVPLSKDKHEDHRQPHQSESESDGDQDRTESSRRCSEKVSLSDASVHDSERVEYAEDFDSLASSEACSPDHWSSPEPSRVRTPKSPDANHSESASEVRSAPRPFPVTAPSSSHRTLMETHIIRPGVLSSALSFSSDEDGKEPASSQTTLWRKPPSSGKDQEGSGSGEEYKGLQTGTGLSSESVSSLSAREAEELQDELGSLDFREEPRHISKLVASKLPGYTM